jgi:hypothetical protein
MINYLNQNWTMQEIEELIKMLLDKLKKNLVTLLIDLIKFYKYWTTWNYPTFTNAIINWCINIIRLIYEKTLNPKI